jgi:hypothetical protein
MDFEFGTPTNGNFQFGYSKFPIRDCNLVIPLDHSRFVDSELPVSAGKSQRKGSKRLLSSLSSFSHCGIQTKKH